MPGSRVLGVECIRRAVEEAEATADQLGQLAPFLQYSAEPALAFLHCALQLDQLACLQQYSVDLPWNVYFNLYIQHFSDLVWIELGGYECLIATACY